MRSTRAVLATRTINSTNSPTVVSKTAITKTAPLTPVATLTQNIARDVYLATEQPTQSKGQITYSYPSRTSNAPRLTDSSHFKSVVPFQESAWSPSAEDMQEEGIAERPQAELAVLCARDIVTAVPDELIVAECTLKNLAAQPSPLRRAYNSVRRSILSRAKGPGDALLAMDENYYRWMVEDNFRFMKKPRHCTWELFYKELSSFSFFFELHPKKPEDSFILHILQHSADEAPKVIWSAEHAVWQGPVIPDMYAAMGTMMARRLKTRTLSFDNGRGTISELNFRHVSPHTSAVHINARPAYYYDAHMREKREENASWYFTKEMISDPGIDEEGTTSFYASAEAVTYHLCAAVSSLLKRPLGAFHSRRRRRNAEHEKVRQTDGTKGRYLAERWSGFSDPMKGGYAAENALEVITDHWLEESPFPLAMMHSRVRKLAHLRPENLDSAQFLTANMTVTRGTAHSFLSNKLPSLLERPAVAAMLEETPFLAREKVYLPVDDATLKTLEGIHESDRIKEEEAEAERRLLESGEGAKGAETADAVKQKKRMQERVKAGETGPGSGDTETWEWLHEKVEKEVRMREEKRRRDPPTDAALGEIQLS